MQPLDQDKVLPYLESEVFPHLDFIKTGQLVEFEEAAGGLVSHVYRVVVDDKPFYLKQAKPKSTKELDQLDIPQDLKLLFDSDRQFAESTALSIFKEKIDEQNLAPEIYFHDKNNLVLVLSEVLDNDSKLWLRVIPKEVNITAAKKLAKLSAEVTNKTYGKINPIRDNLKEDKKVQRIKLRYQCLEVYNKLSSPRKEQVKQAQRELFEKSTEINKVLVHGDFHHRNILVDGSDVGIVDFEEAHIGDPAFDIGILLGTQLLHYECQPKLREKILQSVKEMISLYFNTLNISIDIDRLKERIRKHMGGLMLSRIDGATSKWVNWIEEFREDDIRDKASKIIISENNNLEHLINKIYSNK